MGRLVCNMYYAILALVVLFFAICVAFLLNRKNYNDISSQYVSDSLNNKDLSDDSSLKIDSEII